MKFKNKKTNFFLEAGINHFGKKILANKILNFFLKSKINNLTFMIHNDQFYQSQKQRGINFLLDKKFYEKSLEKCHKKKKKLGLAVCSLKTFKIYSNINFDFYKLLSLGINQFDLIEEIKRKKKPVFISTGFKVSNHQISKCLKAFKGKQKLTLLHAPMSYNLSELNFPRLRELKQNFKLDVGYSNHCSDKNTLNIYQLIDLHHIFILQTFKKRKSIS